MSRRRYISTDISTDPKLAQLAQHGPLPVLLYTWAIPHMDDWGRMEADPLQFKLTVCPAFDVSIADIQEALQQIAEVGLWELYEVDGKQYIAIDSEKWFRYQTYIPKAKRADISGSKIPAPPSDDEQRKTPQNTEDEREAVKIVPSPSPSPSLSLSNAAADARAREDNKIHLSVNEDPDPNFRLIENRYLDITQKPYASSSDLVAMTDALARASPEQILRAIDRVMGRGNARPQSFRYFDRAIDDIVAEDKARVNIKGVERNGPLRRHPPSSKAAGEFAEFYQSG